MRPNFSGPATFEQDLIAGLEPIRKDGLWPGQSS